MNRSRPREFGCARATVNRALRAVADLGLIDRRRKAGTRVALHPVRKATLEIPVIRHEIEQGGQAYGYRLLSCVKGQLPDRIRQLMALPPDAASLRAIALHLADDAPFMLEDRWVNLAAVPALHEVDLETTNANEWLVQNAPFTRGDIVVAADAATPQEASALGTKAGAPLLTTARTTWNRQTAITHVRMAFHKGYQLRSFI